jgi:hypothetical protein
VCIVRGEKKIQIERYGRDSMQEMIHNVLLPIIELFPVRNFSLVDEGDGRRIGYMSYDLLRQNRLYSIRVPQWAKDFVARNYGQDFVIINMRESHVHPERNSYKKAWLRAAMDIGKERPVWIIGDTWGEQYDIEHPPIAIRAALYEAAWCVLGVNCGAMAPAWHNTNVRYVTYKPVTNAPCTGLQDYLDRGFTEGSSWPWAGINQLYQWGDDSYDNIMQGYRRITEQRMGGEYFTNPHRIH